MSYEKYALLGIILFVGASLTYSTPAHASSNNDNIQILDSFEPPNPGRGGLAWDGQHLWSTSGDGIPYETIYEMNTDGNEISSFSIPENDFFGLAWAQGHLWAHELGDPEQGALCKLDTDSGEVISRFEIPYKGGDLAWDGQHLYLGIFWRMLYKFNLNGNEVFNKEVNIVPDAGLAWVNSSLWAFSGGENIFARYDENLNALSSIESPFNEVAGLAWDGTNLWATATDIEDNTGARIYKLEVPTAPMYELSLSKDPSVGGDVSFDPSSGTGTYKEGTEVTVTAEPAENYEFDHWSGDVSGSSKSKTVTVNSDMSITAHFTEVGEGGGAEGGEGGGLPLTWIGLGAGVIIVLIAGIAIMKKT